MVDEVILTGDINDSSPIGSITKFGTQKINFIDSHGQEWLKTGYVTQSFADYPDAIVNDGINFDRNVNANCLWAFSPLLNRWAGVSAAANWTSVNSYTKKAYYSDDNFLTITQSAVDDIICQTLVWSDYHSMFIGTGYMPGDNSDRYFVTSPDGINWTRTASDYAGMYMIVDEATGRIITEHRATQILYYTDDVLSGSFTATGRPSQSRTKFSHPDFGVYCYDYQQSRYYVSKDGGDNWTELVNPAVATGGNVSFAVVDGVLYMVGQYAASSNDGITFETIPEWDVLGSIFSVDDYLLVITDDEVYRVKTIGEAEKIGDFNVTNLGRINVANGIILALSVTNYSTGYAGEMYYKYIGSRYAKDGEFVRIK